MILYACRTSTPDAYVIAKFDEDFNVAATYNLTALTKVTDWSCDCPAGPRPSCRHRKMLQAFLAANAVDTDRFYCYETQSWHQPLATLGEGEPQAAKAADAAEAFHEPLTLDPEVTATEVEQRQRDWRPEPSPEFVKAQEEVFAPILNKMLEIADAAKPKVRRI